MVTAPVHSCSPSDPYRSISTKTSKNDSAGKSLPAGCLSLPTVNSTKTSKNESILPVNDIETISVSKVPVSLFGSTLVMVISKNTSKNDSAGKSHVPGGSILTNITGEGSAGKSGLGRSIFMNTSKKESLDFVHMALYVISSSSVSIIP